MTTTEEIEQLISYAEQIKDNALDYVNWGQRILNKAEETKYAADEDLYQYNEDLKYISIILDSILKEKEDKTLYENDLYKAKMEQLQDAVTVLVNRHGHTALTAEMEQKLKKLRRDINKG